MDKDIVEKVTRLVIEALEEMKEKEGSPKEQGVKIWPHETPLPKPIVLSWAKAEDPGIRNQIITISPYV